MMTHKYSVYGMSCNNCRSHVEEALKKVDGVTGVSVDLAAAEAVVEMKTHIPLETFREALTTEGNNYGISIPGDNKYAEEFRKRKEEQKRRQSENGSGVYYCPMRCEGDKTYNKPGDCPVCGMDLVEQPKAKPKAKYTCPMHPEIIKDEPGSCPICGMDLAPNETEIEEDDKTYKNLLKKFKLSLVFTIPVFLIAMSEMIHNNPFTAIMPWKYWIWVQFLLSLPVVFYTSWMFFERAWRSVKTWNLNMFTLIGIGSGIAFLFSVIALLFPGIFPDQFKTHSGTVYVYFEATTVILTLVLLGQLLEARAHGKTNSAIRELLKLAPNKATRIVNGKEQIVAIDSIEKGDILKVKPGEKIPVDGYIKEGESSIDESMITGEPIPADRFQGDKVISGTINGNRSFIMVAEKVGSETLLAHIVDMVNTASRSKAPIQNLADKISGYFVPVVVGVSVVTFIVWVLAGGEHAYIYALVNAIAVLIIACPCALGLATPMSVMVGVGKGAQTGILIKNAESLQKLSQVDVVIFDKTGTVTEGRPTVEKLKSFKSGISDDDLLQKVISVNGNSEHPLALATIKFGEERSLKPLPVSGFEAVTGKGVRASLNNKKILLGNEIFMKENNVLISDDQRSEVVTEQKLGKTVSYLSENDEVIGFVVISDRIKKSSKEAIHNLQKEGLSVIMFTGDNEETAKAVSQTLNLNGYRSHMLPADKLEEIKKLQQEGKKVAMAGDGINDAPALAQADIGIAMGTGTDVAIQSAGITLIKGDLNGVAKALLLSRHVIRNVKQNLFFALGYNTIGIPIAAGVLFPFFGVLLSPMIAALAMSFSSVSVITNSLRLRTINLN
jgi:P-type Cu+ transporter